MTGVQTCALPISYVPAEEALQNVLSFKRLAQAFSKDYFFGISYSCDSIVLFKRDRIIGEVDENGYIYLEPEAHPFYEEVAEFGLMVEKKI